MYRSANSFPATLGSSAVSAKAPCAVVLHGGSWQVSRLAEQGCLNPYPAARGYGVVTVDDRLAPQWRFPANRDEVTDAINSLKTRATEFGIDPERLALAGRLAGDQLDLLTAYASGDPAIKGVVAWYAPTDRAVACQPPGDPAVISARGFFKTYLALSLDEAPALYEAASPLNAVAAKTVPILLVHGEQDEFVSPAQSAPLAAKLAVPACQSIALGNPWL
jgi:acetyl esterase/lipase